MMVDRFQISFLFLFFEGGLKLLQMMVQRYPYPMAGKIDHKILTKEKRRCQSVGCHRLRSQQVHPKSDIC